MVHDYELVYILDPDLAEDALTGLMDRISTLATNQKAEISSQERWEKRRLAYEINDKREGTYVVMEFRSPTEAVSEMDRILKITDGVLRHLIVRADDAIKAKASGAVTTSAPPQAHSAPAAQPAAAAQPEVTAPQVEEPDTAPGVEAIDTAGDDGSDAPDVTDATESGDATDANGEGGNADTES